MVEKGATGTLYIIATPIGNLADFTFRAVQILRQVDCVLCEDTRVSAVLLSHYQIASKTISLHAHNEMQQCDTLVARLQLGEQMALISDAGTPLLSDAGHLLVSACHSAALPVVPIPGASALVTALSCAGFEGSCFVFEGFLPAKHSERIKKLQSLRREPRLLVFFEAPHRIHATMTDLMTVMGSDRVACLAKELTKLHESVVRGTLAEIKQWLDRKAVHAKGEFVLLIGGCQEQSDSMISIAAEDLLELLSEHLPRGQAATLVASLSGLPRNALYQKKLAKDKSAS